jgi:MYXO-CTERM domain-containing protein
MCSHGVVPAYRLGLLLTSVLWLIPLSANASSGGIQSQSCGTCHSGGPGTTTASVTFFGTAVLNVPMTVRVTVNNASQPAAGFNFRIASGDLASGTGSTAWTTTEISHNSRNFSKTWDFTWTPRASGTITWSVIGNAVNATDPCCSSAGDTPGSVQNGSVFVRVPNGSACGGDGDCASGNCVDGNGNNCVGGSCVCCNASTCAGPCQSCATGSCNPRPASTVCRNQSCSGSTQTNQATCGGSSSCPSATFTNCNPYVCGGTACRTNCGSSADCTLGNFCNGSGVCELITNECSQGLDDCHVLATCVDPPPTSTLNNWTCTCPPGYSGNGRTPGTGCVDNDECALNTDNCDVNATCANTPGSFTCTCNGPEWVGDGVTCVDYNECGDPFYTAMCDPNATCQKNVPGFQCNCNTGYRGNGFTCTEIDECAENTDDCDVNATCANTPGSWTCTCNMGWQGTGQVCSDIDECQDEMMVGRCSLDSMCFNSPGSWECICNTGFRGDGFTCTNIDECVEMSNDCDVNATCTDTIGRWMCACNTNWEGSGVTCTDVNECTDGTSGCGVGEVCVNVVGAPNTCDCAPGYSRATPADACLITCGDAQRGAGEDCDDGNTTAGDGCSASCDVEEGWACSEPPFGMSTCMETCGDGLIDPPFEECDDGTGNSDTLVDACRTTCQLAFCGDGVADTGEECDEGDNNSDSASNGCRTTCNTPYCGDGVVDTGEICDPGGGVPGSALSETCTTLCNPDAGIDPDDQPVLTGGACSCRVAGSSGSAWPLTLLAALALLIVRRRQRT